MIVSSKNNNYNFKNVLENIKMIKQNLTDIFPFLLSPLDLKFTKWTFNYFQIMTR